MSGAGFDHRDGDPSCDCIPCWCERIDHERATLADDEDNRGAFAFGGPVASAKVVPGPDNDVKLAGIIGACMASMTAEGLHAVLWEAARHHQSDTRPDRWCESCRGPMRTT